jgi:hypothetical protein
MIGFRFDDHHRALLAERAASFGMSSGQYARRVVMDHLTHAHQEATVLALTRLEALVISLRDELRRDVYDLSDTLLTFLNHTEVVDEGAGAERP